PSPSSPIFYVLSLHDALPILCCNYFKLKDLLVDIFVRNGCSEKATAEFEKLIESYASDGLNLICGEFVDDSDRCSSIVVQTPKRSEEHTSELLSRFDLVCRLL